MDDNIVVLGKNNLPNMEDTGKRFPKNPFFDYLEIKKTDKMIFAKTDSQALNPQTGEIMGQQVIAKFKKVDSEKFVKIFTDKISTILELSTAGHKLLTIVLALIQKQAMNTDILIMPISDAQEEAKKMGFTLSKRTYDRAIADIIRHGILARHYSYNMYFINPAIIYNGDRTKITFVEQYEIVSKEELAQPSLLE